MEMIFHDADGSWTLQLFAISNIWVGNEGGQKSRINSSVSATLECKKKPDISYLKKAILLLTVVFKHSNECVRSHYKGVIFQPQCQMPETKHCH